MMKEPYCECDECAEAWQRYLGSLVVSRLEDLVGAAAHELRLYASLRFMTLHDAAKSGPFQRINEPRDEE